VIGVHVRLKFLMYSLYIPVFALRFTPLTTSRDRSSAGSSAMLAARF